jgi:hypothetical protein
MVSVAIREPQPLEFLAMDDKEKNNPAPGFQFIPTDPREWNLGRKIAEVYALVNGPGDAIKEIIKIRTWMTLRIMKTARPNPTIQKTNQ